MRRYPSCPPKTSSSAYTETPALAKILHPTRFDPTVPFEYLMLTPSLFQPHFSAAWSRTGRKGPYACYYVHCEPGKAFIGGGIWGPAGDKLLALRLSIDRRPRAWHRALNDPDFKRMFLPKLKADAKEKAAMRAFAAENKQGALTVAPSVCDHTNNLI